VNRKTLAIWIVPILAVAVFVVDQLSKYWVSTELAIGQAWMPLALVENVVVIRHVRNSGAAFGMFPAAGNLFLLVAVLVVLGIIRYYYSRAHTAALWVRISLGLMLGGALGNMIDRFRFGFVVDFIDLGWWPVFNAADSSIVVGVTMLAVYMAFFQSREVQAAEQVSEQPPAVSP
jgi:signal peptidase II